MAGVLVGLGFAVKVTIALVGLGLAVALILRLGWRWRRLWPPLAALGAGFAVTAGTAVAISGSAMLQQSSRASDMVSIGSPWRVIRTIIDLGVGGTAATDLVKAGAIVLAVALAVLLVRGLPGPATWRELRADAGRDPGWYPGVAFALALAWLLAWPYVLPWYDAIGWALLPLVLLAGPVAEGMAWLLLARTAALGFGYLPARQTDAALPSGLGWLQPVVRHGVTPAILAAATAWLVVVTVRAGRPGGPRRPGAKAAADVAGPAVTATKAGWPR